MQKRHHKTLRRDSKSIAKRLLRKNYREQPEPMIKECNSEYQVSERTRAIGNGGRGAIHTMVCRLGLAKKINQKLKLFKVHLPYHESDHVLNLSYNVLSGGTCLEDIERLRQCESYLTGWERSASRPDDGGRLSAPVCG